MTVPPSSAASTGGCSARRLGGIPRGLPIFGTRRLDRVKENLGAADVGLSDEDIAAIEARLARIEVTGERLPPALLKVTYR
jgi:hypothetical protein